MSETEKCGQRITGFPPVCDENARILILGSMPSVESLRRSFYYAHPRNAFWPMMADILSEPVPETAEEKADMLIRHRIALWDSVHTCSRPGSLDSAIRDPQLNDFAALFNRCPRIHTILFNGGTAERLYLRGMGSGDGKRHIRMPSTSPAYTMKTEEKKRIWKQSIEELLNDECNRDYSQEAFRRGTDRK